MNNGYYETLDENFIQALNLYETDYTNDELIDLLKDGNIVQKQIAALRLEGISSKSDADVLVDNLTGQDGKVREAVSLKLYQFMSDEKYLEYFKSTKSYDVFLDAITDINANICRNVICAISNLKFNKEFCECFCPKLINLTKEIVEKIKLFDFQEGKYKVNKEVFKLYWCLETIYTFFEVIELEQIKLILLDTKDIEDYTIREKTAKILTKPIEDEKLLKVKEQLKNDTNYYVRRYFNK